MSNKWITTLKIIGTLLISTSIIFGGWFFQASYSAHPQLDSQAHEQAQKAKSIWETAKPESPKEPTKYNINDVIGTISIPKLGPDYSYIIVEGIDDEQLAKGVGHYPTSAPFGKLGNVALAGHHSGDHIQPFRHLMEVSSGDTIVIDTKVAKYTYIVDKTAQETIVNEANSSWVLHEPSIPDFEHKSTLTLTTCTDFYESPRRSILFAELQKTEPKL